MQPVQAVVLAEGTCQNMAPLTDDTIKALLPVANKPLLSFPLKLLADASIKHVIVVTEGEVAESAVGLWLREHADMYKDMQCEVVRAPEGATVVDCLQLVAPMISSPDFILLSGDVITDEKLLPLMAKHIMTKALATVLLAPVRTPPSAQAKPGKAAKHARVIALDIEEQLLLHSCAAATYVWPPREIFQWFRQLKYTNTLSDGQVYILSRHVLQLLSKPKEDPSKSSAASASSPTASTTTASSAPPTHLLPILVQECINCMPPFPRLRKKEERRGRQGGDPNSPPLPPPQVGSLESLKSMGSVKSLEEVYGEKGQEGEEAEAGPQVELPEQVARQWRLRAHVVRGKYFQRVTSVEGYLEINKEVAAVEHLHLASLQASKHDNIVPASVTFGNKATVGQGCVLGERVVLGDKANVKRSVIGSGCVLGANVKIVNSVLMDDVEVEDGANIQGCTICTGALIRHTCTLISCQVGRSSKVPACTDAREEAL